MFFELNLAIFSFFSGTLSGFQVGLQLCVNLSLFLYHFRFSSK